MAQSTVTVMVAPLEAVRLTAPVDGATYAPGTVLTLRAVAPAGATVEFVCNGTVVGTKTAPYTLPVTLSAGVKAFSVRLKAPVVPPPIVVPPAPILASPDGTYGSTITDAAGHVISLGAAVGADFFTLRDGVPVGAPGSAGTGLLWLGGVVYVVNSFEQWYRLSGDTWITFNPTTEAVDMRPFRGRRGGGGTYVPPVGQSVLAPADFNYIGSVGLPLDTNWGFSSGAIAGRKVGSDIHLFVTQRKNGVGGGSDAVGEMLYQGIGTRLTYVTNWGDVTKNQRVTGHNNGKPLAGLLWDPTMSLLFWSYGDLYNSGSADWDPSIGCSVLTGSDNAGVTAYGPWRTYQHSQKTRAYMFHVPAAVQAVLGGGKRIAVGAPQTSGNIASPFGAMAFTFAPVATSTPADTTANQNYAIDGTNLLYTEFNSRQTRPDDWIACSWNNYGLHDSFVTFSAGNGNLLSTSGAGSLVVTSAGTPFFPGCVGQDLYIDGGTNWATSKFRIASYQSSSQVTVLISPTPGAAGSGGTGVLGSEPQEWHIQDGSGCNGNGALCGGNYNPQGEDNTKWNNLDSLTASAWVEGPTKSGLVILGQVIRAVTGYTYLGGGAGAGKAHYSYGPVQSPGNQLCVHGQNGYGVSFSTGDFGSTNMMSLYIYSEATLLEVANGTKTAFQGSNAAATDGYDMSLLSYTGAAYPQLATYQYQIGGAYFEPESKLLFTTRVAVESYASEVQPVVDVFEVNC